MAKKKNNSGAAPGFHSFYHDEIPDKPVRVGDQVRAAKDKIPEIVVIGGGTGAFSVLSGLKKYPVKLTAVISMADDGGSTGVLREEFGILPPGDIRRALIALSHADNYLTANLFNYRFEKGGLNGHSFGNLMLTALEGITGSFAGAIKEASQMLGVEGEVLPVTFNNVRLCAELENGKVIKGQANIDIPKHDGGLKIKKVFFEKPAKLNPKVRKKILEADLIVIGPGDLYTSLISNLIVKDLPRAIRESRAKKVYVVNIMTKWGETAGFRASDFIETIEDYIGGSVLDYALINTRQPTKKRARLYEKEKAEFVTVDKIGKKPTVILGNFLRDRGFMRHDPDRLAKALISLV